MAGETLITVVGNLVADPELRWTANGAAVVPPKSGLTFASLTVTSSATFGLSAGANPTNEPMCRFDSIFPFL